MVKRETPIQVNLPNGRTLPNHRRASHNELPLNVRLRRPYRQREAPRNRRRQPLPVV